MTYLLEVCVSNAIVATALAIVAGAAGKLSRRPALTHTLWLLVLLKLITPPIVRIPIVWQTAATSESNTRFETVPNESSLDASVDEDLFRGNEEFGEIAQVTMAGITYGADAVVSSQDMAEAILPDATSEMGLASTLWGWVYSATTVMWLWLAGSACWFVAAVARMMQFHQLLRHGRTASSVLQQQGASIARRMGLGRCPELWIVPGRISPLLWAMGGKARLILPNDLLECLAPEQQATLLAHELAHARRRDHWVRWVEFVALGLYWWHPVAWLARRAIHRAEEQCCDAWVVWALPGRARAYAEALLETVGFLSGVRCAVPPVASGIGHVQLLRRRLTMILRETLSPRVSWHVRLIAILFGLCVLPLAPYHSTAIAAPGVTLDYGMPSQSDREIRDLERRMDTLERKLDRVIDALESRETSKPEKPAKPAKKSAESVESAPAQPSTASVKDMAKKEAAATRAEAARAAQEARRAGERARKDAERVDPDELAALGRQLAESIRENFDPERLADLARQIGEAVNTGIDPAQMAELGRQIGEAVNKSFDPKQMEELGRQIEQAVNENFSPERMKEFERQIEEAVNRSLKNIEIELEIDEDGSKPKSPSKSDATKPEPKKPTKRPASSRGDSTRSDDDTNANLRQFERRMNNLERKMDRLLDALESRAPASKP
jgi:beta-lactamase regulating signal transducer with metallopeptidase domain